jgi:hypothetical protein
VVHQAGQPAGSNTSPCRPKQRFAGDHEHAASPPERARGCSLRWQYAMAGTLSCDDRASIQM